MYDSYWKSNIIKYQIFDRLLEKSHCHPTSSGQHKLECRKQKMYSIALLQCVELRRNEVKKGIFILTTTPLRKVQKINTFHWTNVSQQPVNRLLQFTLGTNK